MTQSNEKKPDFSGVVSGVESTARMIPNPEQVHVVEAGESLSKIAKHYYQDANQWKKIYEANRDVIKNPDLIHPGQKLKIPAA
ncbi:MAG: LysM peptidoglycan-binding domain-containing protein [Candidatus Eisenbacteria bacterium]|uniref:LysM peptidoglycan-binding domain-containing protein n=1 Tax=Eiseniibacteriota bacterium TaxID=2212470 RepID=A0A849SDS5_UNCEI|nr:LysM peptidoglycan-binding domain-containing protein [Candidatus Eisenbacteria bacterium]